MAKKKSTPGESQPSSLRKAKPETVLKRLIEKKFKAWLELQLQEKLSTPNDNHLCFGENGYMQQAFLAGAKMGHNGAFKTE